jgi:hypothetical protein
MKKTMKFGLMVCLATIIAMFMTGCGTTGEKRNVKDLTPTSAMCDESSRSTRDILGWHNETVKMDVASTNANGYFHSDNSTSYSSGFHPIHAVFGGLFGCLNVALEVPTALIIGDGRGACIHRVPGDVYDVGGGCSSGWVGNVRLEQNYPQAVQGGGYVDNEVVVSAPAMSYQQQQVQRVADNSDGYQVLGYDSFGLAIYVSPRYPGWYWYHNQWGRQAPIARYNGGFNRGGYGATSRPSFNTGGYYNRGSYGSYYDGRGGYSGDGYRSSENRGGGYGGNRGGRP